MPDTTTTPTKPATMRSERTRTRTAVHEAIGNVRDLINDIDSGDLCAAGIVLEPVEEDDTLVTRLESVRTAAGR